MPSRIVGCDVGGTFTDLVLLDEAAGRVGIAKVPTTPENQAEGFMAAIDAVGVSAGDLDALVHGTTTTTNALLEKKLSAIAFWKDDTIPPPERVLPKVEQVPLLKHAPACLLLEHKDTAATEAEPLAQFGLTVEETRMPATTHDDGGAERRLDAQAAFHMEAFI